MFTSKTWRIVPPLVIIALLITALAPFGAASAQEGIELLPLPDEPIPVDYVFTASFTGELQGTLDRFGEELENLVWYDFYGRKALVGTVIATGETALALETGTQPMAAFEAGVRLPYHFPAANEYYQVVTHGGIAGGGYHAFVSGAPSMQPGDSLAAAGTCGVNSNIFQPYLTQGYLIPEEGDTFESLAEEYAGDASKAQELYEENAVRLGLESMDAIPVGYPLLTPESWPPNTVTSFGIPYGGSVYISGVRYRFRPENPCVYLGPEALALRDQALKTMQIPPLSAEVVTYRQGNFPDARNSVTIYAGDWNEGAGWSWYGDPWIIRYLQETYHVAQGDMETVFFFLGMLSNPNSGLKVTVVADNSGYIDRLEVDNILIFRTSSDPPDMYHGVAFDLSSFIADPASTYTAVRAAYQGEEGTEDAIPFGALIQDQSAQLAEFGFATISITIAEPAVP